MNRNNINKEELVQLIRDKVEERDGYLNREAATEMLNIVLESIVDTVKEGKGVSIMNFGKFEIRERAARKGRNPQNGEEIVIPARKSVGFSAGKLLKEAVPQEKKAKHKKKK